MRSINQRGIAHVAVIAVVIVVVVVGAVAWRVASNTKPKESTTATQTKLQSKSDIANAKKEVDGLSVDTDLDPAQLDKDLADLQ